MTGLIDEDNLDSLTVKNITPDPDKEAVSVDLIDDFFVRRKVEFTRLSLLTAASLPLAERVDMSEALT